MKISRKSIWKLLVAGALLCAVLVATGMHKRVYSSLRSRMISSGILKPGEANPEEFDRLELKPESAQAMQLLDEAGQMHLLTDFPESVVFFNKWATWCAPCVAEMPNIHDLYLDAGNDVRFLMVTWDTDFEKAKRFKAKHGYTFPIYQVYGFLPESFKTPSIPATFVIQTKKGQMYRYLGMRDYDTPEFKEFLKSLGAP